MHEMDRSFCSFLKDNKSVLRRDGCDNGEYIERYFRSENDVRIWLGSFDSIYILLWTQVKEA